MKLKALGYKIKFMSLLFFIWLLKNAAHLIFYIITKKYYFYSICW
ncbi:hypothetical protein PTUN_a1531 [Pseudoalteromonas tunicata]|nr:hypothetical protein PTUN_a1531 [Pseudoalteromonas tunicata]